MNAAGTKREPSNFFTASKQRACQKTAIALLEETQFYVPPPAPVENLELSVGLLTSTSSTGHAEHYIGCTTMDASGSRKFGDNLLLLESTLCMT